MRSPLFALVLALAVPAGSALAENVYGRVYDTLSGEIFGETRIVMFNATEKKEALTDKDGAYWIRDLKPGPYLVRIVIPKRGEIVGRAMVYAKMPTTIVNLDLARIEAPDHDDNY